MEKNETSRIFRTEEDPRFTQFKEKNNIPFATLGMPVCVNGKCGTIIGVTKNNKLSVDFHDGVRSCHPTRGIEYLSEIHELVASYPA